MRKTYAGFNDANYAVTKWEGGRSGKMVWQCPYYGVWRNMLTRCYSEPHRKQYPTYVGCKVCSEWKYFMTFKAWMETQYWEGKHLDKDFLGDGKLYSSETCCFVPKWLNVLFPDRKAREYPMGVYRYGNKFRATVNIKAESKHLGYFDTPEEAGSVYCKAKLQYVQDLMKNYPDPRIKEAVLKKVTLLYVV